MLPLASMILITLVGIAAGIFALYLVIRLAVRHGIQDARKSHDVRA